MLRSIGLQYKRCSLPLWQTGYSALDLRHTCEQISLSSTNFGLSAKDVSISVDQRLHLMLKVFVGSPLTHDADGRQLTGCTEILLTADVCVGERIRAEETLVLFWITRWTVRSFSALVACLALIFREVILDCASTKSNTHLTYVQRVGAFFFLRVQYIPRASTNFRTRADHVSRLVRVALCLRINSQSQHLWVTAVFVQLERESHGLSACIYCTVLVEERHNPKYRSPSRAFAWWH